MNAIRQFDIDQMIKSRYLKMIERSKIKNFEILPFDEFSEFTKNSEEFKRLREAWIASDFDFKLAPSIDRIDNKKGYLLSNIQWLTRSSNSIKGQIEVPKVGKKVKLVKGDEVLFFESQGQAERYLGVKRGRIREVLKRNHRIKGWKPHRIE
jgi:hypothetical protein